MYVTLLVMELVMLKKMHCDDSPKHAAFQQDVMMQTAEGF